MSARTHETTFVCQFFSKSREAYFQRKAEKRKELKREEVEAATVAATVKTKGAILFFKGPELKTSREDIKVFSLVPIILKVARTVCRK